MPRHFPKNIFWGIQPRVPYQYYHNSTCQKKFDSYNRSSYRNLKLIHFYNDIDVWELYDLQADPTEMHNLYGQKEYEPVVTELKTELARLQEQYNDPVRFSPDRDKE